MADNNAPVRRIDVHPQLSGPDRIKLLLRARGYNVAAWARHRGFHAQQVWQCLAGDREYPHIRNALAEDTGKSRETIDRLIAGEPEEAATS